MRYFWTAVGALVFLLFAGAFVLQIMFQRYLKSDAFRQWASAQTSGALHVDGEYRSPFFWEGASVYAPDFMLREERESPWTHFQATGIRANFNWRAIWRRVWRIEDISISRWDAHLALPLRDGFKQPENPGGRTGQRSLIPMKFEIGEISIEEFNGRLGEDITLQQSALRIHPSPDGEEIEVQKGKFSFPHAPALTLEKARIRVQKDTWFLTEAVLQDAEEGRYHLSGEWNRKEGLILKTHWERARVATWLMDHGNSYIEGQFSGDATLRGAADTSSPWEAQGNFFLADGKLKNVPLLERIATFTQLPQFRHIPLTEISGRFVWNPTLLTVKDFILESRGLLRVEGEWTIDSESKIRGDFFVGVSSQSLQWLPGSQERVFTTLRDGYYWTPMRVSGTLSSPQEDLSVRLIAAMPEQAAKQVMDRGQEVIQKAPKEMQKAAEGILQLFLP